MNTPSASRKVPFSELPGRHERHLRRRLENPLMPRPLHDVGDEDLLEVQRLDHEELVAFIQTLQGLVVKAINLPPNCDSEVVLGLKEQLDQAYETSAGLADDQSANQAAIRDLTGVIMRTVRRNAAGDGLAGEELQLEETARAAHYQLLRQPLVADLLHPDSLIQPDELVPVLLGETEAAVGAALELFDETQLGDIVSRAAQQVGAASADPALQRRLEFLRQCLTERADPTPN